MRWNELKEKRIRLNDSEIILINPVFTELINFIQQCKEQSVRGMLNEHSDVYVWDAMYSSHGYAMSKFIPDADPDFSFFIATKKENVSPTWGEDGYGVSVARNIVIHEIKRLYVSMAKKLEQSDNKNFWRIFK